MAEHIYQALANEHHALIEAGTVGKSLAYLIPLIYYTVAEGKRAVVATNTITLQEQLFTKEPRSWQKYYPLISRQRSLRAGATISALLG